MDLVELMDLRDWMDLTIRHQKTLPDWRRV